jgi:thiol-disulfide isomerase/thioredoxin
MRREFLLLIIVATTALFSSNIKWYKSFKDALSTAKRERKRVLLFVYSSHCPYCIKMEREIFSKEEDIKYLSKEHILLKMPLNRAKKIFPEIYATPTIYILAPNKELLASEVGYQNEEFFYWTIGKAERKYKEKR